MEFTVKRDPFLRELGLLAEVASKKGDRPILACIRMEAKDDELLLDATDSDVSMGCVLGGTDGLAIESDGVAVIDAKRLHSYVRGMESAEVFCATDATGWLELRYPNRKEGKPLYRMPGFPAGDFPAIPEAPDQEAEDGWKTGSIPAPAFANMAAKAEYALSGESGTLNVPGAQLEFGEDAVRMVATDGHKLIVASRKGGVEKPWEIVIPRKALASIASMCRAVQLGGMVAISRGPNHVFAFAGGRVVAATMLAGQFPAWRNITKGIRMVKFAALDTKRFRACAARAAAVLDARGIGGIKLQFSASGVLRFNAQSSLFGEADEWMDIAYKVDEEKAANMADKDLTVRVGHAHLLDFLATAQSEVMKVAGSDASQPVKLVDGDLEQDGFETTCIIMTINEAVAAQAAEVQASEKAEKAAGKKEEAASAVAGAAEKPRRARGKK